MFTPATDVVIDGGAVSIPDLEQVARGTSRVILGPTAFVNLRDSRAALEHAIARGEVIYGVNTGFGSLAQKRLDGEQLREVQRNLILSHASGVGDPLPEPVVRGMLLLLAASLARGLSGVRPNIAEAVVALLNAKITPIVPSVGSAGASGDLAPLAHAALVLLGEGEAWVGGARKHGSEALASAGLAPLVLEAKEGLALVNGTHLMAAWGALALADAERLFSAAICASAMSIDACRGTDAFLDARVHEARGQRGQIMVAERLRLLMAGSQIVPSHLHDDPRVQDPYSLRCAPQVLGAALDILNFSRGLVEQELSAVSDNPLVFAHDSARERQIVSAGNFHGMPLAVALDMATLAIAHVAGIAERRVYYILAASDAANPLHPHLSPVPGLHSGLMIAQYVAAACCNEIVGLTLPSSPINIPTSAGMEDYNSFGVRSASKFVHAIQRATEVVAIELLCAAEALEYQRPLRSGAGVESAHALVRSVVSRRSADRPPAPDIAAILTLIQAGAFSA
jgi:histidine ammonia-lyase